MYYVYVLKSKKKDWLYVGFSDNLKRRFKEHQNGLSVATRPYRPFELVFYEAYKSKRDAQKREIYFKTTKGKRALKLMLQESLL
ncbi:hypothetical protein A3G55_01115 [Candidatus Giovannonibacteria bacterium RIFCSPLOWO2_12_FULL_44_25]|uniref:GIY-YIG domain-containing protein n=1 Tax=Candidatus Giovannonibacteria bacterium RIFCSPHIGHO2_02_FULL_45_40 TaxID=1798337 RepID=A0A1F5W839_9BACT|nr:MAG: hypothetical protein A2120_03145 [Candidatus Giovannonibacteria bacterium GWA2_45_15]OGF59428.1 MAG: hypothetical protein A2W40_00725 [Candidatus Giovannonibacteria bacterium RIFCSPHIGHO2_01_45_12]OGF61371.1 MAG: hypothetical protein A2656_04415 [Candidatus Giovannonibacteria bacterium RIFCSPHIGHO2_01_FULL_44_100]OGF71720.1 MAG: hypothetical protein A3C05_03690 [Candidatus Giovannonibacteria bacterium RIFCSPHIGHO2_02_FULL_45_40]OGF83441.1 MAG: hypothetical protein A3E63_00840 [Candidatu